MSELSCVGLVVHDENTNVVESCARGHGLGSAAAGGGSEGGLGRDSDRKYDGERRALPEPCARGRNVTTVELDDVPHEGEPETEPAHAPGRGRIGLPEPIEREPKERRLDSHAGVGDGQGEPSSARAAG